MTQTIRKNHEKALLRSSSQRIPLVITGKSSTISCGVVRRTRECAARGPAPAGPRRADSVFPTRVSFRSNYGKTHRSNIRNQQDEDLRKHLLSGGSVFPTHLLSGVAYEDSVVWGGLPTTDCNATCTPDATSRPADTGITMGRSEVCQTHVAITRVDLRYVSRNPLKNPCESEAPRCREVSSQNSAKYLPTETVYGHSN